MFRTRVASGLIVVLSVCAAVAESSFAAEKEFHNTYSLEAGQTVSVKNVNGNVTIRSGSGNSVDVFALIKSNKGQSVVDRARIEVTTVSGLSIETKYDDDCIQEDDTFFKRLFGGHFSKSKANVEYTITVPDYARIARISTTNGSISSTGTRGDAVLSTTNGNVDADHLEGTVEAHSTNGNITLHGTANFTKGRTTNGNVNATLPDVIESDVELSSTNGSITVTLPAEINAVLDLSTTNGGIDASGFTMTIENTSKRHLRGRVGSGGPRIGAHTTNGGVRLVKK